MDRRNVSQALVLPRRSSHSPLVSPITTNISVVSDEICQAAGRRDLWLVVGGLPANLSLLHRSNGSITCLVRGGSSCLSVCGGEGAGEWMTAPDPTATGTRTESETRR